MKMASGSKESWLPFFDRLDEQRGAWICGRRESAPIDVSCNEDAAFNDPECAAMHRQRGETRDRFASVVSEPRTQCINGTLDLLDSARGVCCQQARPPGRLPKVGPFNPCQRVR
jgi:hypothetical protein